MKTYLIKLFRINFGLFIYALGLVMCYYGNIGLAPWDALNTGLIKAFGGTFGLMNIIVGIVALGLAILLKEQVGLGTIINAFMVGIYFDLIVLWGDFHLINNYLVGLLMMLCGLFLVSLGTYFYISAGLGAGPRDSLMIAVSRCFSKVHIGIIRGCIEGVVLLIGWLLGGRVSFGTVVAMLGISFFIQLTFRIFQFKPTEIEKENLNNTMRRILKYIKKSKVCK